ncbi:MAG TPA: trypsin-like peptidase domain-containing protein [Gemmatimonadales bacterium]|nr:trypsin-like peptidase domain-containing protein [Gemmatimonadales bacterium]
MKAQFTFLSGSRAGQTDILSQAHIAMGRHPDSELKFDPEKDLDVSSRHAVATLVGEQYILRDIGSTNGTFVNGKQLTKECALATKDIIRFGPNGPQVEFTAIPDRRPSGAGAPAESAGSRSGTQVFGGQEQARASTPPQAPPRPTKDRQPVVPAGRPLGGTTARVRVEVARQTRRLRLTAAGLLLLLVGVSGAYLWQTHETDRRLAAQRQALLGQVDSLMQQIGDLSAGSAGLRAALDSAQLAAEQLKQQLAAAPNDADQINSLKRRLEKAIRQQRTLAGAAALDAHGIAAANRDAVAMVWVQFPNGKIYTGTAFAVRSDPNGGLLITNKHVVSDSNGTLASRIGVVFNGTNQNFRADVVKVHPGADLALLHASVHRGFPVVKALADSTRPDEMGEPAAVLGFPLGLDLAGGSSWAHEGVAATLTLGTVSRTLPDLLQLDSYGAEGSSGSPIFDRNGSVIGVLYGGQTGSNGRIIYAVPVRFVHELLAGE